ncbi:cell division protein FtsW [Eggerthellaceae bacterium zg-893]|nr:cell division protein FtsW [Eggerthellaceae bacterium zg-893]
MAGRLTTSGNENPAVLQAIVAGCAAALMLTGLVMIYSTGSIEAISLDWSPEKYFLNQLVFAVIGTALALALWLFVPYRVWNTRLIYVGILIVWLCFIGVALTGEGILGARRWLDIGPFRFQPSEFAKIAFVMVTAYLVCRYQDGSLSLAKAAGGAALCVAAPLAMLLVTQSDLGTSVICVVGIGVALLFGGVRLRWLFGGLGVLLALGAVAILATPYRRARLFQMLGLMPSDAGDGAASYQLTQSLYTFADGGLLGVGLGNSKGKFQYLPEAETDFIFSIVGEELGFVGALVIIVLFLVILACSLKIAASCPDPFGRMLAGGCAVMLVFQAFLNIACVIGIAPTTGKPLPFLSYGGSSLMSSLVVIGIILSVAKGSEAPDVHRERQQNLRVVSHGEPYVPPRSQRHAVDQGFSASAGYASGRSGAAASHGRYAAAARPASSRRESFGAQRPYGRSRR